MPPGSLRSSVLLVSAALALIQLYDTAVIIGALALAPSVVTADPQMPLVVALTLLVAASFVLLAAYLWRTMSRVPEAALRMQVRRYLMALTAPLATAFIVLATAPAANAPVGFLVAGVWDLALPLLVTYALFRYQLLDIDLKVKWGIRQSTIAAAFVTMFFIASEAAQEFFGGVAGSQYMGIAATGALVFALAPLQGLAERISSAAVPGVQDTEEYRTVRKREVYRAALESAMEDGEVTEKERSMLATLQDQLDLSAREALELERDVRLSTGRGA